MPESSRILVDVVVRSDADRKRGGDSEQVDQYRAHLGEFADMRVMPYRVDLEFRADAVVHIVNIDRPFDFLRICRLARAHTVVVSPIHHQLARVALMRRSEKGRGLRSTVDRVLPESAREWLASSVRNAREAPGASGLLAVAVASLGSLVQIPRVWALVGKQLDAASAVAVLAPGEATDLRTDTGWRGENVVVVPNGLPAAGSASPWADRDIQIVNVGRIEPRKRSLELAVVAEETGIPVTFVGPFSDPDSAYAREFAAVVGRASNVDHRGSVVHAGVLEILGRSRVLLNVSWVEVQSLVDMEAGFSEAFVVAVPNGNSRDWLPDHVTEVATYDIRAALEAALQRARSQSGPGAPEYSWTWETVSFELLALYRGR